MAAYNYSQIEKKWQARWAQSQLYRTHDSTEKSKFYCLDMFPYPSGAGLHVGHPKGYIATDVVARMKMMQGCEVLHPMGWDAFGLPAENYALKHKIHPRVATQENIKRFKEQLEKIGFTYDWSREINTTDPKFYKWTQWTFLQMFKRGLACESYEPINWCPRCKTGLANEDLEGGRCERCDSEIERKPMRQWVLKITEYADRLLEDLSQLTEWPEAIKEMQRNWIGKSEGAEVNFVVPCDCCPDRPSSSPIRCANEKTVKVFTTRPDTLFGCTYLVLSPEHPLINQLQERIKNYSDVSRYIKQAKKKSDLERTDLAKEKTGVKVEGLAAINPVNNEEVPIFIADYVLAGYGTGAIMAVPAHDERDFEFAKKYRLPIKQVVAPKDRTEDGCFTGEGVNINSNFLNGLPTPEAKKKMIEWLERHGFGKRAVNYKLQDWVFSRQRYWGEPIPVVYCEACKKRIEKASIDIKAAKQAGDLHFSIGNFQFNLGEILNPGWIADENLPLTLPEVESYEPTGTGESPLANIKEWVNAACPKCGAPARRETNTMPQWAGSSWYYLRFIDPRNDQALVDKDKEKYWSPVDLYVGGAEHATRHLIYARFWHKFLYDIGVVNYSEPFRRLHHVGLILAEDGRKMSKRWGNVINPDEIVEKYGADTLRVYEMFMGPFSQSVAWSTKGLEGAHRFLQKVWRLFTEKELTKANEKDASSGDAFGELFSLLHKTIKKVGEDIENFKFNTAIAQMMIFVNEAARHSSLPQLVAEKFLPLLAPFAPHLAEEIWEKLGHNQSIFKSAWPQYDPQLIKDQNITLVIQINGKVRDSVEAPADISQEEARQLALAQERVKKWIGDKEVIKVIFVKGKLINIVVR
ncbi:leucine--tRNA ligase [Candidatus Parcubacteria bacterium]|nr:MAG: leucine--tRNA ligase [Candidatus Parcubacteria bacterium]